MIDTNAMTTRGTVPTGSGPHGEVIDTAGTRAWVTNTYANTVSVIDLPTLSVVAAVPVGAEPAGISYSTRSPAPASTTTTQLNIPRQPRVDRPRLKVSRLDVLKTRDYRLPTR